MICRKMSSSSAAKGIVDEQGRELGAETKSTDPAGNVVLSGAAEALRSKLIQMIGDQYFQLYRRGDSAKEAIFTRKVGHTQRGGRPILFDRFYAAMQGAEGGGFAGGGPQQCRFRFAIQHDQGFYVEGYDANRFRDRWGLIHARYMHPDALRCQTDEAVQTGHRLSAADFHRRHRQDDAEHMRQTLFNPGNLTQPYHSINTDVHKRIRYLEPEGV